MSASQREFPTIRRSALEQAARDYLASRRSTLWGQCWNVIDDGIDQPAAWLTEQIKGVLAQLSATEERNRDPQLL